MLGSMPDDHEQLDPAEALMREVGAQLRQVRLERGEELEEVAEHLRIKSTYLFGIEQGDLSRIPGRVYALGFLRSYADYLGFDGDDLIVQIKSTVANLTDRTRLRIRTPLPESRLPKTPILVISMVAIAAIYAGWSYLGQSGQLAVETVAEVPHDLRGTGLDPLSEERAAPGQAPAVDGAAPLPAVARVPGPVAAPASTGAKAVPRGVAAGRPSGGLAIDERGLSLVEPDAGSQRQQLAAADLAPTPAAPETPSASAGPDAPATEAARTPTPVEGPAPAAAAPAAAEETLAALAPAAGVPGATGEVYAPENRDARVVLRARDSSWIRISSLGGDYLRTHTLQPGDVFLVPNRNDLELWTGNAGGIEVILDGAVLAPIGNDGAVVREVPLDPPSLRARFGRP
jgi:cytoskeleton protein RodZ